MHVKACKKTAKRRHGAAFGRWKDGVLRRVGCKKAPRSCVWAVERRHAAACERWKDGTRRHVSGGKTVCGSISPAITRREAAFGLRKDGTELHFACNNTARSGVWVVERWHGAAFGRHCACNNTACGGIRAATGVLPRSLQCAKTRSHARKAPCTYTSHAAPKHVPMQEKHLAHAIL